MDKREDAQVFLMKVYREEFALGNLKLCEMICELVKRDKYLKATQLLLGTIDEECQQKNDQNWRKLFKIFSTPSSKSLLIEVAKDHKWRTVVDQSMFAIRASKGSYFTVSGKLGQRMSEAWNKAWK